MIVYNVPIDAQRMTIGVQGENNVREFRFDVTEWRELSGDIGTAEMAVQRNGDSSPYAAVVTMYDENTVSWVPTSTDTAKNGVGKIQLMWVADNQTVKTKIFYIKVNPSLDYAVPDDSLDPWEAWMHDIINAAVAMGDLPGTIADAVAEWLEENIGPTTPAIDQSLSVEGAGADAKKTGEAVAELKSAIDKVVMSRTMTGITDLNTITVPGMYNISSAIYSTLSNYPADAINGRLVVFCVNGAYANLAQVLIDINASMFYRISTSSSGTNWTTWVKVSTDEDAIVRRSTLTAGVNMDSVTDVGFYYKAGNVSAINGVNERMANVVVYASSTGVYGLVQVWHDITNNAIWQRTKPNNNYPWSEWLRVAYEQTAKKTLVLPEASLPTAANGKWASSTGNFGKSVGTLKRISAKGARSCDVTWTPTNTETEDDVTTVTDRLLVYLYDGNGDYISYSTSGTPDSTGTKTMRVNFTDATEAIAICIYNSASTAALPNNTVELTLYGVEAITEIFNPSFGHNVTNENGDTRWYKFGYKVGDMPTKTAAEETAYGDLMPVYNTGMILFPPNYAPDGKPVPVIVAVHGSLAYMTKDGTQNPEYEDYFNFLADNGFALIDCYGWTTRYSSGSNNSNPWPIPTTEKAYLKLAELCLDCFNLDRSNVFTLSKSLGGHLNEYLSGMLPVRAAAYLAPALYLNFGYAEQTYRDVMVADMGLTGVVDADVGWTTETDCLNEFLTDYRNWSYSVEPGPTKRRLFFQGNEEQIMGSCPQFIRLAGSTASAMLANVATVTQETGLARIAYPPTKIWCAQDDASVSYTSCVTACKQIRNGGGEGVMRTMPSGTGGHHSVDSDPNAPQTTNVSTPYGGVYASVPTAYYEVLRWYLEHMV